MMMQILLSILLPFYVNMTVLFLTEPTPQSIDYLNKDTDILKQIFHDFRDDKNLLISELMIKVGMFFKDTPYKAATLEINTKNEELVVNLREMDCTTFAENCLAISRTIKNGNPTFEKFAAELQNIRYRSSKINGYSSRLHYFSDWIFDNDVKNIIESVSKEITGTRYPKPINFMSTHPESYPQLKDNPELIQQIAKQEKEISARETYYIPKEKIGEIESKLLDGDIVGITSRVEELDISHVGILVSTNGRIHIMHASTVAKKVIVSDETLEDYLLNSKSVTGIMVARPK